MFKIIGAATLVAGLSAMIGIPASNGPDPPGRALTSEGKARDARTRNFLLPQPLGNPVSFCVAGASDCGKPAADAFCRSQGYEEALTFLRVGMQPDRANLHFQQIKCWHPSNAVTRNNRY
jgi:hypothetical protein